MEQYWRLFASAGSLCPQISFMLLKQKLLTHLKLTEFIPACIQKVSAWREDIVIVCQTCSKKAHSAGVVPPIATSTSFAFLDKLDVYFKASHGACLRGKKYPQDILFFFIWQLKCSPAFLVIVLCTDFHTTPFHHSKWKLMTVIFHTIESIGRKHWNLNLRITGVIILIQPYVKMKNCQHYSI